MDPNRTDSEDEEDDVSVATEPVVVGQKRSLPRGIKQRFKLFEVRKSDPTTRKEKNYSFATLKEAEEAYAAERELQARVQAERKRQRAARPIEEIKAENKSTYGNSCSLERDVANAFAASDESIYVMNDAVRADLCGFFYGQEEGDETLALPIQLKTTGKHMKSSENTWLFKKVRGYKGMVVVCWRDDKKDGWVYDGTTLDDRKSEDLGVTPGGINAKLAINTDDDSTRATPLSLDGIVSRLRQLAERRRDRFPPRTKEYLSWEFSGEEAHNQLKERVGIHLHQTHVDGASDFPKAQNGSFDLVSGDWELRLQFKTACVRKGCAGLLVQLEESAGKVDGKRTWRPYHADAFDVLVVYRLDWKNKVAHVWRIPTSELVAHRYLTTDAQDGKQGLMVYTTPKNMYGRDQWTFDHYKGTQPLGPFPADAEAAAGRLLDDFRSGRKA
jgi:hypothetical protein